MLSREIIIYGVAGLGIAIVVIGIGFFVSLKKKKKKIQKYKESFEESFKQGKDIRQTMTEMLDVYKKGAVAEALKAGLYYLDHSILRDYGTALSFVEYVFDDERIEKMHKQCILMVWEERQRLLTLPDKEVKKHVE